MRRLLPIGLALALAAALLGGLLVGQRVDRSMPQNRVRHFVLAISMAGECIPAIVISAVGFMSLK